jgi:hypothetical protein
VHIRNPKSEIRNLEFKARFSGSFGERTNAAVINVPASIEHDVLDSLLFCAVCEHLADLFRGCDVPAGSSAPCWFDRRCGDKSHALSVVYDLRVDMVHAAVDREPRALGGTRNLISNPLVNRFPYFLACLSSHVAFTSVADCGAINARHFSNYVAA